MAKRTQEDKNIDYLETRYLYEKRRKIYLANEETNQAWDETDIPDFINAWNNNWSISEIAEYLGADQWEIHLLAVDLIQKKKIQGNVHVFKTKRKGKPPLKEIDMGKTKIRTIIEKNEIWVCVKDVWAVIEKPNHSYRKTLEGWGPKFRAKFQLDTPGGRQKFIFINIQGLDKLFQHTNKKQKEILMKIKEKMVENE